MLEDGLQRGKLTALSTHLTTTRRTPHTHTTHTHTTHTHTPHTHTPHTHAEHSIITGRPVSLGDCAVLSVLVSDSVNDVRCES